MSEEKDFYYHFGKMLYKENEYLQVQNMKLIEERQQLKDRINKVVEILHNINEDLPLDLILTEIEHTEYVLKGDKK